MNMNDIGGPIEFLNGFYHSLCKEDRPFVVVREQFSVFIGKSSFSLKVLLIVDKIDLDTLFGNGGHFDDKRHVHIVDDQIHPGKPNNLG